MSKLSPKECRVRRNAAPYPGSAQTHQLFRGISSKHLRTPGCRSRALVRPRQPLQDGHSQMNFLNRFNVPIKLIDASPHIWWERRAARAGLGRSRDRMKDPLSKRRRSPGPCRCPRPRSDLLAKTHFAMCASGNSASRGSFQSGELRRLRIESASLGSLGARWEKIPMEMSRWSGEKSGCHRGGRAVWRR